MKTHFISQLNRRKRTGIYHLVLRLPRARRLRAGNLGLKSYPSGYYVYTGSARRGLDMRILRHLRKEKTRHWHIDWLTQVARVEEIWVDIRPKSAECECHRRVLSLPGSRTLIPRFGSSDCRCPSHLVFFHKRPNLRGVGFQSTRGKKRQRFDTRR
jgi:sugar fermentation stimulation protein A